MAFNPGSTPRTLQFISVNYASVNRLRIVAFAIAIFSVLPISLTAQTTTPHWLSLAPLPLELTGHSAIQLPTGEVLIAGGMNKSGTCTTTSLVFQPSTGTYRPTANSLSVARTNFTLVSVPVGKTPGSTSRIFAIGGYTGNAGSYSAVASIEELDYNPAAKTWSWKNAATLSEARGDLAACWDENDAIIIAGGKSLNAGALSAGTALASSERLVISSMSIAALGPMTRARSSQFLGAVQNGRGGVSIVTASGETPVAPTINEELNGNAWATQGLPRGYHQAAVNVLDPAGIGRMFGGRDDAGIPSNKCEWYDVKAGWKALPPMISPRALAGGTVIAGVNAVAIADTALACLVVAGQGQRGELDSTEIYNLPTNSQPVGSWNAFYPLVQAGHNRTVAIAGSNLPLVTGGTVASAAVAGAEIFQPLSANDVSFSPEELGRLSDSLPLTITNVWLLPVKVSKFAIAPSTEFILAGDTTGFTIPAGGARQVYVYFRPAALGKRTGALTLSIGGVSTDISLSGTGVSSTIALATTGIDFGGVLVRSTKQLCFGAIKNNGTDTTVVDQVIVTPATDYTLISPIGRVKLAPDSVLQVCVEFHPTQQGPLNAPVRIALGSRTYVVPATGKGLRKYITTTETTGCDTVAFVSGQAYTKVITVINSGDLPITLSDVTFSSGALSGYSIASPTLPATIAPGASVLVTVQYTALGEGNSSTTAQFQSDGDSSVNVDVCFVTRSRSLILSQDALNFGAVCAGDTITKDVVVQNPSLFNDVQISGLQFSTPDPNFSILSAGASTLKPLTNTQLTVRFVANGSGAVNEGLVASGSFGKITIPITATVLPQLVYSPQASTAPIGATVLIPVTLASNSSSANITTSDLDFVYDRSMLYPTAIEQLSGGPAIQSTSSVAYNFGGVTHLKVNYVSPLSATGPAFGVRCYVLLGKNDRTSVALSASPSTGKSPSFCSPTSSALFTITPDCQGSQALLGTPARSIITLNPNPASGALTLAGTLQQDGEISSKLYDALGRTSREWNFGTLKSGSIEQKLQLTSLAPGLYFLSTVQNGKIIATNSLTIR